MEKNNIGKRDLILAIIFSAVFLFEINFLLFPVTIPNAKVA